MSALKAHEVARFTARPDLAAGIILVYGPDAGLVRETGHRLCRHYAGAADTASMNVVNLDGAELDADPSRLAVEAKTTSLFGDRRIVRVRGASRSLVMTLAELKDDPGEAVIVLEAGNLLPKDPLRALVEAAKFGRALPCYADTDESLGQLIRESFNAAAIRVDSDAAQALRDTLGNDREISRREIEKLVLFAAESKIVTAADVAALCADNAALVLDEVADAAGTGHAERLDQALDRAFAASVSPQQLLFALSAHFGMLRRLRREVDDGKAARDVLEAARPRPHFSRRPALEQQLRSWNDAALATVSERLLSATRDSRLQHALEQPITRRVALAIASLAGAQ